MQCQRDKKINWSAFRRTVVFIDAANIIYSLRSLGWRMDYKKLYQFFSSNSRCQDIYFYTSMRPNNQKDKKWLNLLRRIGYKTRVRQLKFIRKSDGSVEPKGNLDGYIFIDALDRLADYDTCILLSGDSDFEILVDYLHQKSKQAVVCSARTHVAWGLRRKADKYISLQYFKKFAEYKKTNSDIKSERSEFSSRPKPGETSNPE
ncbi:MAG: NYN domain-containing protein [Candidatus Jacksonbacteria bacterium]